MRKLQISSSIESACTMNVCLRSFACSKHDNLNIVVSIPAGNHHFYICSRTEYVSWPMGERSCLKEASRFPLPSAELGAAPSLEPCFASHCCPRVLFPESRDGSYNFLSPFRSGKRETTIFICLLIPEQFVI